MDREYFIHHCSRWWWFFICCVSTPCSEDNHLHEFPLLVTWNSL